MVITIEVKYKIGESVYLKTDDSQQQRIVFAYLVYRNEVLYKLACGIGTSDHYDFEISRKKDILKTIE